MWGAWIDPRPEEKMVKQYTGEDELNEPIYPHSWDGRVDEAKDGEIYISIFEWPASDGQDPHYPKRAVRIVISKELLRKHMKETPEGATLPVIKLDQPEIYDIIIE